MPIGLRLRFQRDLAFQFPRSNEAGISADYTNKDWSVLGSLDYLRIADLNALADLPGSRIPLSSDESEASENATPLGGISELVLYPQNEQDTAFWEQLKKCISNLPLLYYVRVTISSVAFDLPSEMLAAANVVENSFALMHDVIRLTRSDVQKKGITDFPEVTFWQTLGGPDVVCLSFLKDASSIAFLNHFLSKLRSRSLRSLIRQIPCSTEPPKAHAFSSVQATLCYQNKPTTHEVIRTEKFITDEKRYEITYPCRIAPGTGHEYEVETRLKKAVVEVKLGDVRTPDVVTCWGHRALQLQFPHLAQVVHALQALQANDSGFRSTNIHSVRTTVASQCFDSDDTDEEEVLEHSGSAISWSPEIEILLNNFTIALNVFSKKYLGEAQAHELHQLFLSLSAALRRNDRAASVRDLLPFFDQLQRCMNHEEYWRSFAETHTFADISNELNSLFGHVWRALRNRIEHRAEPVDPSFPNTLEFGASKLLNAYTVAAWVASEILFRLNSDPADEEKGCPADFFAAAVCAGSRGAVDARVLFSALHSDDQPLISHKTPSKWNSPLLAMSLSGHSLYHPEEAFVHCLHEMAEAGLWAMSEQSRQVRVAINRWAFHYYISLFVDALGSYLETNEAAAFDPDVIFNETTTIPTIEAAVFLSSVTNEPHKYRSWKEIERQINGPMNVEDNELQDIAPFEFLTHFPVQFPCCPISILAAARGIANKPNIEWDALNLESGPDWLLQGHLMKTHQHKFSTSGPSALDKFTISEHCSDTLELVNEIMADFAMVRGLQHILSKKSGGAISLEPHITTAFKSILKAIGSSYQHPTPRHRDIGILRWAIQFATWCESGNEKEDFQECLIANLGDIDKYFARSRNGNPKEWPLEWNDTWLRNYWFEKPVFFPIKNECPEQSMVVELRKIKNNIKLWDFTSHPVISAIVDDFYTIWTSAQAGESSESVDRKRLEFISHLWAKSQKFFVKKMFAFPVK